MWLNDDDILLKSNFGFIPSADSNHLFIGLLVVLIGSFCFGTMHVPVRRFTSASNDGFFIQWLMSLGSLMVGFAVNVAMGSPPISLPASGGGVLWSFANLIAQFVIPSLGLAPAFLLWSTTNILTGWSTGRFGLFGLRKKVPEHPTLNTIGLITILMGDFCFAFIKKSIPPTNKQVHVYPRICDPRNEFEIEEGTFVNGIVPNADDAFGERTKRRKSSRSDHHQEPPPLPLLMSTGRSNRDQQHHYHHHQQQLSVFHNSKQYRKWMMRNSHRLLCIFLSLLSGFFYSATVMPVIYIQDNPDLFPDAPHSGLNYIFSHYFGVFLGSSVIFVIYAIIKWVASFFIDLGDKGVTTRNNPTVNPSVILPSLGCGAIWGCGMGCLFLSNDLLTQTVTYPVLITIPGCVASLWSIYFFNEIKMDYRNSMIIAVSFTLILFGAAMRFVSKSKFRLPKFISFFF